YYMGAVIAEQLRRDGHAVTLVTPQSLVSAWSVFTDEQQRTQSKLIDLGVEIVVSHALDGFDGRELDEPDGGDVPFRRERVTV
ncbi:MAG: hypothetical protein V3S24_01015, partial [Candidatus Tectomicrobia bacterium]